jgi:hypothetical protein
MSLLSLLLLFIVVVVVVVVGSAVDGQCSTREQLAPNGLAVLDDGDIDHVPSAKLPRNGSAAVPDDNVDVRSIVIGQAVNDRVVDAVGRATKHVPNPYLRYAQVNSHGAFSLQGGCRCVNNSWTDFL